MVETEGSGALIADPFTEQPFLCIWQCQSGIFEEEGVGASGVREEEQAASSSAPCSSCISTDQRLLGVLHHWGGGGACQWEGREGRSGYPPPRVHPSPVFLLHWLWLGGESLLKAAEARGDLIVKLGPRSVTG